jgi:hypothetical protein
LLVRPEVVIDVDAAKKLAQEESGSDLQVIRSTPKGNLTHPVTTLSLTFNQPMIPVTGINDLKDRTWICLANSC